MRSKPTSRSSFARHLPGFGTSADSFPAWEAPIFKGIVFVFDPTAPPAVPMRNHDAKHTQDCEDGSWVCSPKPLTDAISTLNYAEGRRLHECCSVLYSFHQNPYTPHLYITFMFAKSCCLYSSVSCFSSRHLQHVVSTHTHVSIPFFSRILVCKHLTRTAIKCITIITITLGLCVYRYGLAEVFNALFCDQAFIRHNELEFCSVFPLSYTYTHTYTYT